MWLAVTTSRAANRGIIIDSKAHFISIMITRRSIMEFIRNPFFWACISMFGLVGAGAVVSGKKLGSHPLYGFIVVAIFLLGRIILVLPCCPQPRFGSSIWSWWAAVILLGSGLIFSLPAFTVKPVTAPDKNMKLHTTGFYAVVRNPIYLGEILLTLGWSLLFRSIYGLLLLPLWWLGLLLHTVIEEETLERELADVYFEYKKKVRGRLIPGLPL